MSKSKPLNTTSGNADGCNCPIHENGDPHTYPKGWEFEHRVHVEPIPEEVAGEIYEAHHSYAPETPNITWDDGNHGIFLDNQLVGAISYNYHIINKLKLYVDENGNFHRDDSRGTDDQKHILMGNRFGHVARICIGVNMPNLASCALSKSQEYLVENTEQDIDFLLTFIRNDHVGSMLKALIDKGWQLTGFTRSSTGSGNREEKEIHSWSKQRWLYEVGDSLDAITSCPCTDNMIETIGKSYVCENCNQWYGFEGHSWAPNN